MNVRDGLTLAAGAAFWNRRVDLAAFLQLVDAGHHDLVARLQAGGDFRLIAFRGPDFDAADGDRVVRLDQINVGVVGIALNGGGGQQRDAGLFLLQQPRIHELIGEERAVLRYRKSARSFRVPVVWSIWLSIVCERAGGELVLQIAVPGVHREFLAGAHLLQDRRQLIFGDRENHADGLDLRDDQHAVGVGGVNDVAGIHQAQTDDAGDRRRDVAVSRR